MKLICIIFFILLSGQLFSQDIVGQWNNIDEVTGKPNSTIEIYKKGELYFGKIIEIFDPKKRADLCVKCKGDLKNEPILGMHILLNLEKDGDRYSGGQIFDPKTGKEYKAEIWVDEKDSEKLNVRGYVAFFYDTREWRRKK